MIYTELTVKAMRIAYSAHHGQLDKGGVPYIFHPIHIAEQMKSEYAVCTALLHDVVEDTDISLNDLEKEFPKEVTEAVRLLTHKREQGYTEYLRGIRNDPLALEVKLADIRHNSDQTRLSAAKASDPQATRRLWKKYSEALRYLTSEE